MISNKLFVEGRSPKSLDDTPDKEQHAPSPSGRRIEILTDVYDDQAGRKLQLWCDGQDGLIVAIRGKDGHYSFRSAAQIRNGLNRNEDGRALLARLGSAPSFPRDLALVEKDGIVHLWPRLRAAGKDEIGFEPSRLAGSNTSMAEAMLIPHE